MLLAPGASPRLPKLPEVLARLQSGRYLFALEATWMLSLWGRNWRWCLVCCLDSSSTRALFGEMSCSDLFFPVLAAGQDHLFSGLGLTPPPLAVGTQGSWDRVASTCQAVTRRWCWKAADHAGRCPGAQFSPVSTGMARVAL